MVTVVVMICSFACLSVGHVLSHVSSYVDATSSNSMTTDFIQYKLQDTCDDASQRLPVLKAEVPLLAHAREVYTPNIFTKFQDEYMKS